MSMPTWPRAGAPDEAFERVADEFIRHGNVRLDALRTQLRRSSPEIRRIYAKGLKEIVDIIADRLAISATEPLRLQNIPLSKMDDLMNELVVILKAEHDQVIPQENVKGRDRRAMRAFGLFLFLDFLLLRTVEVRAPLSRRSAAARAADDYSRLARAMAEINANLRDPMEIDDVLSG